jgi:hypothetical protein
MTRRFDLDDELLGYALGTGPHSCAVTKYWMEPNDLEHHWLQNQQEPSRWEYLKQQGWLDSQAIEYILNRHGFRGDDFTESVDAVALGCSYTFGHALPQHLIWTWKVSQTLGIKIANLGMNGAGISSCFRVLKYWLPTLRPKWILLLAPHLNRLEVVVSQRDDRMHTEMYLPRFTQEPERFLRDYWFTDYNGLLERERSILAMRYLAVEYRADIIMMSVEQAEQHLWGLNDLARDFEHPGPRFQQRVADFFLEKIQRRAQD